MHGQISLELAHSVQIILLFSVFLKHLSNCDAFSGKKKKKSHFGNDCLCTSHLEFAVNNRQSILLLCGVV